MRKLFVHWLLTTLFHKTPSLTYTEMCINKGLWRRALKHLREIEKEYPGSLAYWKQRTLAELLCGNLAAAQGLFERRAAKCSGYSEDDWGDFWRDVALFHIRHGQQEEMVFEILDKIRDHHLGDDRHALWCACMARAYQMAGDFDKALEFHRAANRLWDALSLAGLHYTPQWQVNNRFHEMFSHVAKALALGIEVIETDPNRKRRLRARLIRTSKAPLFIDKTIARLLRLS